MNGHSKPTEHDAEPNGQTQVAGTYIRPQWRRPYDSAVTFEEYYHYAQKTREEQRHLESPILNWRQLLFRRNKHSDNGEKGETGTGTLRQLKASDFTTEAGRLEISDEEWTNASRAFRTASWGACKLWGVGRIKIEIKTKEL